MKPNATGARRALTEVASAIACWPWWLRLRLADLQDAPDMNAKRKAIWVGGLIGGLLFLLILALGPIWGGLITAEQPATAPAAVKRATP